jgi:hypothetical protein
MQKNNAQACEIEIAFGKMHGREKEERSLPAVSPPLFLGIQI